MIFRFVAVVRRGIRQQNIRLACEALAGDVEDVRQIDAFCHLQNAVMENRSHDFGDGLVVVKTQNPQRLIFLVVDVVSTPFGLAGQRLEMVLHGIEMLERDTVIVDYRRFSADVTVCRVEVISGTQIGDEHFFREQAVLLGIGAPHGDTVDLRHPLVLTFVLLVAVQYVSGRTYVKDFVVLVEISIHVHNHTS